MNATSQLDMIAQEISSCTNCPLHTARTNVVPGEGPPTAPLLFVGEAPGAKEDEFGRPFVGRSGMLLTELIKTLGMSRDEVFITSILKCRPPGNRTPTHSEIEACRPYLERQMEIIRPRFIVLLGSVAISSLIGPWQVKDAHGRFYEGGGYTFFMTYHPAAALRFPRIKQIMLDDFQTLKRELELCGG